MTNIESILAEYYENHDTRQEIWLYCLSNICRKSEQENLTEEEVIHQIHIRLTEKAQVGIGLSAITIKTAEIIRGMVNLLFALPLESVPWRFRRCSWRISWTCAEECDRKALYIQRRQTC